MVFTTVQTGATEVLCVCGRYDSTELLGYDLTDDGVGEGRVVGWACASRMEVFEGGAEVSEAPGAP